MQNSSQFQFTQKYDLASKDELPSIKKINKSYVLI